LPRSDSARLLKRVSSNARLVSLNFSAPIRSRAVEEGGFQIPLWGVPFVLLVLYVCLFSGLSAIGLVGPDEPRYAAIARAMAETHDWVTPRLWGRPWFEKPVLYYWCAGIAMRVFGVGEFAARLPSALAGLLAVAATAWMALRSYGVATAWFALLMLPASVAMIGFSRSAGPDMLFAGLLTAAMAIAYEILQKPRVGSALRILFGFFLGAAVLAKGPAAVILAGGSILLWTAFTRQWRAPFRFLHPLVIAIFCATALPWYILCAMRNPDFLRIFIWQHNFERYVTPIFEHRQPFWFYGPILLLAIFPWVLFSVGVVSAAINNLKSRSFSDSPAIFFASWAAFTILFFSLSQSKLPGYILPAVPPIFVLLANWMANSLRDKPKAVLQTLAWTGALFLPLAFLVFAHRAGGIRNLDRPEYVLASGVAFILGLTVVILALRKRTAAAFIAVVLLVVSIVGVADAVVLPRLDSRISARPFARKLQETNSAGSSISTYHLTRGLQYGMAFYLNRELLEWNPEASEPDWIISGGTPDQPFLDQYTVELSVRSPETGQFIALYRHR
jgi:4-amino-4-deoxy-L-arabinose transferase-like glycosyltransferase